MSIPEDTFNHPSSKFRSNGTISNLQTPVRRSQRQDQEDHLRTITKQNSGSKLCESRPQAKQTRLIPIPPEFCQLPFADMVVSNEINNKGRSNIPQRYSSLQYRNAYKEQSNFQNRSIFSFGMRRLGERKTEQSSASQTGCLGRPSKLSIRSKFNGSRLNKQVSPLSEGHPISTGVTFDDSVNWSLNDLLKQEGNPTKKMQRLLRSDPGPTSFSARESPDNSAIRLLDPECSSLDCGNPRYTTPEKFCTICRSDKSQAEDLLTLTAPSALTQASGRKSSQDDWSGRGNSERRVSFALDQVSVSPIRSGLGLSQQQGSSLKYLNYNLPKRMERMLENLKRTGLPGRLSPLSPTSEKKVDGTVTANEKNAQKPQSEEVTYLRGQKQQIELTNPPDSDTKPESSEALATGIIGNDLQGQDGKCVNMTEHEVDAEMLSTTGDQTAQDENRSRRRKDKLSPVYFLHFLPRGPLFNRKHGADDNTTFCKTHKKKLVPPKKSSQMSTSEAVANETDKARRIQADPAKMYDEDQVRGITSPKNNSLGPHIADETERCSTPPSTETLNSILEGTVTLAKQAVVQPVVQDHKKQTTDNAKMIFRPSVSGPESSQLIRNSTEHKHHQKHLRESAHSLYSKRPKHDHNEDESALRTSDSAILEDWMNELTENNMEQNRLQKVFRLAKDVHELTKDDPHWKQFLNEQRRSHFDRDIDRVVEKLRHNALQLIELEQAFRMSKVQELQKKRRSTYGRNRESLFGHRWQRRNTERIPSVVGKSTSDQRILENTLDDKLSSIPDQADQAFDYYPENIKSIVKSDDKEVKRAVKRRISCENEQTPDKTSNEEKQEARKPEINAECKQDVVCARKEDNNRKQMNYDENNRSAISVHKEGCEVPNLGKSTKHEHWTEPVREDEQEELTKARKSTERESSPMSEYKGEHKESPRAKKFVRHDHLPKSEIDLLHVDKSKPLRSSEEVRSPTPAPNAEQHGDSRSEVHSRRPNFSADHGATSVDMNDKPSPKSPSHVSVLGASPSVQKVNETKPSNVKTSERPTKSLEIEAPNLRKEAHADGANTGVSLLDVLDSPLRTFSDSTNQKPYKVGPEKRPSATDTVLENASGKQFAHPTLTGQTELPLNNVGLPESKHSTGIPDVELSSSGEKGESRPTLVVAEAKSFPCGMGKTPQCGCGSLKPDPHIHELLLDQYCSTEQKVPMLNEPTPILPVKSSDGFRNDSLTNLAEQSIIPKEVPADGSEFYLNKAPLKTNLSSIRQNVNSTGAQQTGTTNSQDVLFCSSTGEPIGWNTTRPNGKQFDSVGGVDQRQQSSSDQMNHIMSMNSESLETHEECFRNKQSATEKTLPTKGIENFKPKGSRQIEPNEILTCVNPNKKSNALKTPSPSSNLNDSNPPRFGSDSTDMAKMNSDYHILVQPQTEGSEAISAMEISPLQHELAGIIKLNKNSDNSPIRDSSTKIGNTDNDAAAESVCPKDVSSPCTAEDVFLSLSNPSKASSDKITGTKGSHETDSRQNTYIVARGESLEVNRGSTSLTDIEAQTRTDQRSSTSEFSDKIKELSPVMSLKELSNFVPFNKNTNEMNGFPDETQSSLPKRTEIGSTKNKRQLTGQRSDLISCFEVKNGNPSTSNQEFVQNTVLKMLEIQTPACLTDPNTTSGEIGGYKVNTEEPTLCENTQSKLSTNQLKQPKSSNLSKNPVQLDQEGSGVSNLPCIIAYPHMINKEREGCHLKFRDENELSGFTKVCEKQLDQDTRNLSLSPQTSTWTGTVPSEFVPQGAGSIRKIRSDKRPEIHSLSTILESEQKPDGGQIKVEQNATNSRSLPTRNEGHPSPMQFMQFQLRDPKCVPDVSGHREVSQKESSKSEPMNLCLHSEAVPSTPESDKNKPSEHPTKPSSAYGYNTSRDKNTDKPVTTISEKQTQRTQSRHQVDSSVVIPEGIRPGASNTLTESRDSRLLTPSHSQNPTEDETCCPNLFSLPVDSYHGKGTNIPDEVPSTRSSIPNSEIPRMNEPIHNTSPGSICWRSPTARHRTLSMGSGQFHFVQSDRPEKNNLKAEIPCNADTWPVKLSTTSQKDKKGSQNILSPLPTCTAQTMGNSVDEMEPSKCVGKPQGNLEQTSKESAISNMSRCSFDKSVADRIMKQVDVPNYTDINSRRESNHSLDLACKQSIKSDNSLLDCEKLVPLNRERPREFTGLGLTNNLERSRLNARPRKFSLPSIKESHISGKKRASDANSADRRQSIFQRKCLQAAASLNSPSCHCPENSHPVLDIDHGSSRSESFKSTLPIIENQTTTLGLQQRLPTSKPSENMVCSEPEILPLQSNEPIENESKTVKSGLLMDAEQPQESGSGSTKVINHAPLYSEDPSTRYDEVLRHSSKRPRKEEESVLKNPRGSGTGKGGGGKRSRKAQKYRSSAKKSTILTVMVGERVSSEQSMRQPSPDEESLPSTTSTTMLRSLPQHPTHERSLDSRMDGEILDCDQITDLRMHLQPEPTLQPARPVSLSNKPLSETKRQAYPLKPTVPDLSGLYDRPAGDLVEPSDTRSLQKIPADKEKPSQLIAISKISMNKRANEYTLETENINFDRLTQFSNIKRIEVDIDSQENPTILIEQTHSTANKQKAVRHTEISNQLGRLRRKRGKHTLEDGGDSRSRSSIQSQQDLSRPLSRNAKAQMVMSDGTSAEFMLQYMATGVTGQMCHPPNSLEASAVNQKRNSISWSAGFAQGTLMKPTHSSQSGETHSGAQIGSPESLTSSRETSRSYSSGSRSLHRRRIYPRESQRDKSEEVSISICISEDSQSDCSRISSSSGTDSSDTRSLDRQIYRTVRGLKANAECDNKTERALCHCSSRNQIRSHSSQHHHHQLREKVGGIKHRGSQSRSKHPASPDSYCSRCMDTDEDSRENDDDKRARMLGLLNSTGSSRRCRSQCAASPDFENTFKMVPNVLRLFRLSSSLKDLSVHLIYRELRTMLLQRFLGRHEEEKDALSELICRSHYI